MYSIIMLIYIMVLFLFSTTNERINQRSKAITTLFCVAIFSILISLRDQYTPDTSNYISYYIEAGDWIYDTFSFIEKSNYQGLEQGFLWTTVLFKDTTHSSYIYYFILISFVSIITSIIGLVGILKSIYCTSSKKINYILVLLLYLSYYGIYYSGIAMRCGMAIGISLMTIYYLYNGKYARGIIGLLLALSFHNLSILVIPIFVVLKYFPKISKKALIYTWIVYGILLFTNVSKYITNISVQILEFAGNNVLLVDYIHYLKNINESVRLNVLAMWLFIMILLLFFESKYEYTYKFYNVILGWMVVVLLASTINGYNRIADWFLIFVVPIVYITYDNWKFKSSFVVIVLLLYIIMSFYKSMTDMGWPSSFLY